MLQNSNLLSRDENFQIIMDKIKKIFWKNGEISKIKLEIKMKQILLK